MLARDRVFGFAAVLGMIGLCAIAAKKAGLSAMTGVTGKKRRLSMREMLPIDARRRLAIVKCDDTEYLILLGPTGETVVDKDLKAVIAEEEPVSYAANPFSSLSEFTEKFRAAKKNAA